MPCVNIVAHVHPDSHPAPPHATVAFTTPSRTLPLMIFPYEDTLNGRVRSRWCGGQGQQRVRHALGEVKESLADAPHCKTGGPRNCQPGPALLTRLLATTPVLPPSLLTRPQLMSSLLRYLNPITVPSH